MIKSLYPPFQKWSEKGSVYIVSDTHFEDDDCLFMDPDWPTPEEHLKNFNIHKNDTLIHLGDVGNVDWIRKIKGYKVLIMGNHDIGKSHYERRIRKYEYDFPTLEDVRKAYSAGVIHKYIFNPDTQCYEGFVDNQLFDEVYDGPLLISDKIVLSHEPICVSAGITGDAIAFNIHGHDHSGEYYNDDYHLNCASNVVGFQLTNLKDVIQSGLISKRNLRSIHRVIIDRATDKKKLKHFAY